MSRSYRRNPITKDRSRGMKALANRKVRKIKWIPNGRAYKKLFQSYDIHDKGFRMSENEYKNHYYAILTRSYNKVDILHIGNRYWVFSINGAVDDRYSYADWYRKYNKK